MKVPRPYQSIAIDLGSSRNALIADDRGLGKTLEAIEIGKSIAGLPRLIVCNKTAKQQWADEILDQCPHGEVIIFEEPIAGERYQREDVWVIAHFWQVSNFITAFNHTLWGMVCIDEAHRIKNRDTDISNALKRIESIRKIALTGTPIEHGPRDFFSILQWLYPQYYTSLWDFVQRHCVLEKKWTPNGFKNKAGKALDPALLAAELSPFTIRRTKLEVAPELPDKRVSRVPVLMTPRQSRLYKAINESDDIEVEFEGHHIIMLNKMAQFTLLHQIASLPISSSELPLGIPSGKLSWITDYLKDNSSTRCIILSRYRKCAEAISKLFGTALVVGGKTIGLDEFVHGSIQHISGSIGAMAESLSLEMADCIIFIDQDYNSILMDQAQDRHHRITSTSTKDVIMLYTPGTVDDLVWECIVGKWNETDLIYNFIKIRNKSCI